MDADSNKWVDFDEVLSCDPNMELESYSQQNHASDQDDEEVEVQSTSKTIDEDELRSVCDSEDDEVVSNPISEIRGLGLYVAKKYSSLEEIRKEIDDYAVTNGYGIKFSRIDKCRLTADCVPGCEWHLHASQMQNELTFQIKKLIDSHNCSRQNENRRASAKWVANKYLDRFKSHPTWDISDIMEIVKKDWMLNIAPSLARRARIEAKKMNEGFGQDQYKLLWSYAEEIRRTNPGSTVKIKGDLVHEIQPTSTSRSKTIFERMYVCMAACKRGLLQWGRPIICLDGCHLKGPCPGQLLTAVSIDDNDGIYPVSIAIVEVECNDSWNWFIKLLKEDIESQTGYGWTFISDRQKRLQNAVKDLLPLADQRWCLRHMYANFKQRLKGKKFKDAMWNAARAPTPRHFETCMRSLWLLDKGAHEYLRQFPVSYWATHAFSDIPKCDMGLNNLSESFNAFLLPARDKPIVTMFTKIIKLLMTRIVKRNQKMAQSTDVLCPRIKTKLQKLERASRNWSPTLRGNDLYEVSNGVQQYSVNMEGRVCSCYRWQLTWIPCVHAVSCLTVMRVVERHLYVNPYYYRATYMQMYSNYICPMNGPDMWPEPEVAMSKILPPVIRRQPGRPKKKRVQDVDEPRCSVSRRNNIMTCRRCRRPGHNSRTCQEPPSTSRGTSASGDPSHEIFMGFYTGTQDSSTSGQRRL